MRIYSFIIILNSFALVIYPHHNFLQEQQHQKKKGKSKGAIIVGTKLLTDHKFYKLDFVYIIKKKKGVAAGIIVWLSP